VRRLSAIAVCIACAVVVVLGVAPAAPAAKPPTVFINGDSAANYKFTPRVLQIRRRQRVHWQWDSNGAHNVRFPKLGKTSVTGASETFSLRFKRRGTFRYLCTVHGFRGKVVAR